MFEVEGLHYLYSTKFNALISCTVTAQMNFAFVFAYVISRFSHDMAHIMFCLFKGPTGTKIVFIKLQHLDAVNSISISGHKLSILFELFLSKQLPSMELSVII